MSIKYLIGYQQSKILLLIFFFFVNIQTKSIFTLKATHLLSLTERFAPNVRLMFPKQIPNILKSSSMKNGVILVLMYMLLGAAFVGQPYHGYTWGACTGY